MNNDPIAERQDKSAAPIFKSIRIEAFRGFATEVELNLDASVVIVHGPNGLGKTSLFDAFQWVLLGDLTRLREARTRVTDEYIVNAYRAGSRARVELRLVLGGEDVTLSREGDRHGSVLNWNAASTGLVSGQSAEGLLARRFGGPDLELTTSLKACGLLQQDAAREVLLARPNERFNTFSKLLGLGDLAAFERSVKIESDQADSSFKAANVQVEAAEQALAVQSARLLDAQTRQAARPAIDEVTLRLNEEMTRSGYKSTVEVITREAASSIAVSAASLAQELLASSAEKRRNIASTPVDSPTEEELLAAQADVDSAEQAVKSARQSLFDATEELNVLESHRAGLVRMAGAVLPLINADLCPACGQSVDRSSLVHRLEVVEGAVPIATANEKVVVASQTLHEAEFEHERAVISRTEVAAALSKQEQWLADSERVGARIIQALSAPRPWSFTDHTSPLEYSPAELEDQGAAATRVAAVAREVIAAWDASVTSAEAVMTQAVQEAELTLASAKKSRENLALMRNSAAALSAAVRDGRMELVKREFARLGPLAQDIFSRMDPHPTFQDIDLVSDIFRSVGTTTAKVSDPLSDITADPMLVFSSAQTNIVAISYLMALNLASSIGPPVLLLDDPLQAMDDVNVLGFSDLCRHVRRERQLFVSTHERRFARLLERKLAPRVDYDSAIELEFVGWDRAGPTIKAREIPHQRLSSGGAFANGS